MTRALNIEEAWVENAAYFFTSADNHLTPGHQVALAGEADFAVNSRLGGEIDLPSFLLQQPLGAAPATMAPIAAGLRAVVLGSGTSTSSRAAVLAVEIEGQYWLHPRYTQFPGLGNSVTLQFLGGLRRHANTMQFETGLTQPVGHGASRGWFGNISLGRNLPHGITPQLELDFNTTTLLDDGRAGLGGAVTPQIGWQTHGWLFALGQSLGWARHQPGVSPSTVLMIEHDLD